MVIHLAFFFAGLSVRSKFFSDGHKVGEETERRLAAAASETSFSDDDGLNTGKMFDNEYILFDFIQLTHLFCVIF